MSGKAPVSLLPSVWFDADPRLPPLDFAVIRFDIGHFVHPLSLILYVVVIRFFLLMIYCFVLLYIV